MLILSLKEVHSLCDVSYIPIPSFLVPGFHLQGQPVVQDGCCSSSHRVHTESRRSRLKEHLPVVYLFHKEFPQRPTQQLLLCHWLGPAAARLIKCGHQAGHMTSQNPTRRKENDYWVSHRHLCHYFFLPPNSFVLKNVKPREKVQARYNKQKLEKSCAISTTAMWVSFTKTHQL